MGGKHPTPTRHCAWHLQNEITHFAQFAINSRWLIESDRLIRNACLTQAIGNPLHDLAFATAFAGNGQQLEDEGFRVFEKRSVFFHGWYQNHDLVTSDNSQTQAEVLTVCCPIHTRLVWSRSNRPTGTSEAITRISTRRFFWRSLALVFAAIGWLAPKPATAIRCSGSPARFIRSETASARAVLRWKLSGYRSRTPLPGQFAGCRCGRPP